MKRRWQQSRSPGRARISRKAIAQGMSECSPLPCMLVCALYHYIARETAGAARTRHSLLPRFSGETDFFRTRALRRGIAEVCLMDSNAPRIQVSSPPCAQLRTGAGDPVPETPVILPISRGVLVPRFRGDDSGECAETVIPGWSEGPDPESRDSGFALRPGMTVETPKINPLLTIHRAKFAQ